MIRRYVRFTVEGRGEDAHGKFTVRENGVCDARLDPMKVAIRRNGRLAGCGRIVCKVQPAFRVMVSGARYKSREDVQAAAVMMQAIDGEDFGAITKGGMYTSYGGRRRGRR